MYALINPSLSATDLSGNPIGAMVVQIESAQFPVPQPLYWRECPPEVTPYDWFVSAAGFERVPKRVVSEEEALAKWRQATEVTRFQARAALYETVDESDGQRLFDKVEAIMANPTTPMLYKLAWQDASSFRRMSPTALAIGQLLGRSAEQLDQLFLLAKTIEA